MTGQANVTAPDPVPSALTFSNIKTPIENGFDLMYRLQFQESRAQFMAWMNKHPEDPIGDVAIAASYLFEELYYNNVLSSEFFLDDKRLFGGIEGKPDESRTRSFREAYKRGSERAQQRLEKSPNDADAIFALTLATGMQANYLAMLEKKQRQALGLMKEHEGLAKRLLELKPESGDAWVAIGTTNYLIGSLPRYLRFLLWFTRVSGNKSYGMEKLQVAAEKGYYLRPFAKIFLAFASLREKQEDTARELLSDLVKEFPENHLFVNELTRMNDRAGEPEESE